MTLDLTPDELLSTTRAVRRRMDFERPVERDVLLECFALAQQAPTASHAEDWHFVAVTDPEKKSEIAEHYIRSTEQYLPPRPPADADDAESLRWLQGWKFLDRFHEIPVYVIPCITGRYEGEPSMVQASKWGSIIQATWSFMLAARARGLGTIYTTLHLRYEREVAEILGIPYDEMTQAALIPVGYSIGTDFKPGRRKPLDTMLHWDHW